MSRYRVTYEKGGWLSPTWKCEVYDRINDKWFYGTGMTKKEAKDQALDRAYEEGRNSYEDSDTSDYDYNSSSGFATAAWSKGVGYFISIILVIGGFVGCGFYRDFYGSILFFGIIIVGIVMLKEAYSWKNGYIKTKRK